MWLEMDRANRDTESALKLNKDMIKATYASVVVPDIGFAMDISGFGTANVGFVNHGKAITNITAQYDVTQESLPDEKRMGFSKSFTIKDSIVRENEGPNHYTVIDGFSKRDLDLYKASREGIRVSGTFQYDNGFGDVITNNFCLVSAAFNSAIKCSEIVRYMHSLPPQTNQ